MQSEEFAQQTARLRDLGGQRVWSLMISLFGDLAQGEGDVIDGPALTAIMSLLQVRPEATRVALHRLRNDGWITSQKSGRIRRHSLTQKGRVESAAASPRIYAKPGAQDDNWQLVMLEAGTPKAQKELHDAGFVSLTARVYLGPSDVSAPSHTLRLKGETVPHWLPAQLEPQGLRKEYAALLKTLTDLKTNLPNTSEISPVETAVLRCLIVHNWRRLVLKHPSLPATLTSPDWPGLSCHVLVSDLLDVFPRPALGDITPQQTTA